MSVAPATKDQWRYPPSDLLPVKQFRQILWLPLRSRRAIDLGQVDKTGKPHWVPMSGDPLLADDLKGEGEDAGRDDAYSQFLYFHPFVRRFLFEQQSTDRDTGAGLRIWTLRNQGQIDDDYARLDVTVPIGQQRVEPDPVAGEKVKLVRFAVNRCRLYQFPGPPEQATLMLEIELSWKQTLLGGTGTQSPLMLADVLDLLDMLRRTHPPYFPSYSKAEPSVLHHAGGRYPLAAQWGRASDPLLFAELSSKALEDRKRRLQRNVFDRSALGSGAASAIDDSPLDTHWADLLGPAFADGAATQIEDERMPLMAYVAMPSPDLISPGDWKRLAFCDYHGNSANPPHADAFGADFEQRHCYDRYFQPSWGSFRMTNTGYAFVMVGQSAKPDDKFPSFFESDAFVHFRRHYASMGLLAQYNKAALLCLSNRLSEAMLERPKYGSDSDVAYRKNVRQILASVLEFTHRHRFEGVSNQLQAGELYGYWVQHLGLKALHQSVMEEARAAHEFIVAQEEAEQTAEIKKLTRFGLWFAAAGITLGVAGAGFPIDKPLSLWHTEVFRFCLATDATCGWSASRFVTVVFGLGLVGLALATVVRRLLRRDRP
jgi:hypothetical protein